MTASAPAVPGPDWTEPYDVIIVGAGIAGLVAAWYLRDRRILVLEAAGRVGGRIRSEPCNGYWLNLGPHLMPPPQTSLGRVVQSLGIETKTVPGTAMALWSRGRLVRDAWSASDPLRLRLPPSARLSLARDLRKVRRGVQEYVALGQARAGESPAQIRARLLAYRDGESFSAFLGPTAPAAAAILRAAVNRVSAEPEELAAGAGIAQFAGTFSPSAGSFHNLVGGTGTLPLALSAGLGGALVTGARVTRVRNEGTGVVVTVGTSRQARADHAIVATPAHTARQIIDDQPPALAVALESVAYGPYVVAAFLTNERRATAWDDIYAMAVAGKSFNMFFNTVNVLRTGAVREPGGSVMVYGAAGLGRRLLDKSDDEVIDLFLRDLDGVFPDLRQHVAHAIVQRWETGIAFARPGRHRFQPVLERPLGRIHLTGDYIAARAGMDTAAEISEEVVRKVRGI